MDIKNLREEIDQINKEMVALFSKRMDVSEQIAKYKQANKLPIRDTERERQLLNKVSDLAGEEMARSKDGDENSYKSPVEVNQIDWNTL